MCHQETPQARNKHKDRKFIQFIRSNYSIIQFEIDVMN